MHSGRYVNLYIAAKSGEGIAELRTHLLAALPPAGTKVSQGRFRLAIDRCFTLSGIGTVVTGTSAAMANAAFLSLATQASISLVNNKGNLGKTFKELDRKSVV